MLEGKKTIFRIEEKQGDGRRRSDSRQIDGLSSRIPGLDLK